jgi:phosphoribosylamine--glycine ligase
MNILLIGSGGREHAIAVQLKKSKLTDKLYCTPGNGGISQVAECFSVKATDIAGIVDLAKKLKVDLVFVAPDDPLAMGLVDALEQEGIKTFGPRRNAAIIESSKSFSKGFMKKYGIPTAEYKTFTDFDKACKYVKDGNFPAVIKCDGLALGKGVIIAENFSEAEKALREIMIERRFGDSGAEVVTEEFMQGKEVTVLAFTDGKTVVPMLASSDYKRALDGNNGPNTGGMGVIAPTPYYSNKHAAYTLDKIIKPTVAALGKEGRTFKGCLYFGLMLQGDEVKVVEYNARFGDPETQALLPLLETDFAEIVLAVTEERLDEIEIKWSGKHSACVVLASGGYPGKYETGYEITGTENAGLVYHAGTKLSDGKLVTAGGRVLNVTGLGDTLDEAVDNAYKDVLKIKFDNMYYRNDIGKNL